MLHGNYSAGATIVVIAALSLALVLATMIVPSLPSLRQTSAGLAALGTMYFALIGLGFMFVEIGIIQRVDLPWTSRLRSCDRTVQHDPVDWHWQPTSERAHLDTPGRIGLSGRHCWCSLYLLSLWFPVLVHASEAWVCLYARW